MSDQPTPEQNQQQSKNFTALKRHIQGSIIGQNRLIERLLVGTLTNGHILLEGLPGLAKTTAVHSLASGMHLDFCRIQFTPDLIPGDITGSDIFLAQQGEFKFLEGPVFNNIILADEINRAPPKVQSALLEAMQERQVTVAGETRKLSSIFQVIATQNPLDQEGTYPLPEAQLDRFIMKVHLDYPDSDDELEILQHETKRLRNKTNPTSQAILKPEDIHCARRIVNHIYMNERLEKYIITLVHSSRNPSTLWPEAKSWINHGASPRATLALAHCARAMAFIRQRDFVEPADIIDIAYDVLNHRIGLSFSARAEGITPRHFIDELLARIPIP